MSICEESGLHGSNLPWTPKEAAQHPGFLFFFLLPSYELVQMGGTRGRGRGDGLKDVSSQTSKTGLRLLITHVILLVYISRWVPSLQGRVGMGQLRDEMRLWMIMSLTSEDSGPLA